MTLDLKFLRRSSGSRYEIDDVLLDTGERLFVHAATGTDASNLGQTPDEPLATLAYAISLCTANKGAKIYLMPGHTETLAAVITLNKAGVSIIGLGSGYDQPELTCNYAGDLINITAVDCRIEHVYFQEATAAATAQINLAAARAHIRNCTFECGANDLDNITVPADGAGSVIEGCTFRITANGPDSAITVEGAADNLAILDNYFDGGSTTNVWDDAAIDLGSQTPANVRIEGNTFAYGTAVVSTGATPRVQGGNRFLRGARSAAGVSIDLYASASITGVKSGTAEDPTTLTDAVNLATAGDRILLYPGTYTVTAALALDVANVTVRPVHYVPGQRTASVEIANDTDDINTADITAVGVTIQGIFFTKGVANTSDGTELLDVGASRCTIQDCIFDLETRTNADGINFATSTQEHLVERCLFTDPADGKGMIVWACSSSVFRENYFDFSAADALASEQIASPGDGNFIVGNFILSDGATDPYFSWQSSPGKQVVYDNHAFGTGADADGGGDDGDLDQYFYGNTRDGGTDGTSTTLNPSVS